MSTNHNVILSTPESGSTANYTLDAGANTTLSFNTGDIADIRMEANGSLVITLNEGGEISIDNYQALADAGTELSLADGMVIDSFMIENGFDPSSLVNAGNDNNIIIDVPSENVVREISLEPGQDYYFNFELQSPVSAAAQEDGSYIFEFANGAKLVLSNYAEAMAWDNTPSLFTDTDVCALTNEELITTIQQLVMAPQGEEIIEDDPQSQTAKSEIVDGDDVANIDPAAGDELSPDAVDEMAALADALAEVQPAAGDDGAGASSNSGYGFNSEAAIVPLGSIGAVGPLGRTALDYRAPSYDPQILSLDTPVTLAAQDDRPDFGDIPENELDETSLDGGPLVATGNVSVNYGLDTPGAILPNAQVSAQGSVAGSVLMSGGVQVELNQVFDGYVGLVNGQMVFEFHIDGITGDYTYTQYLPLDHADGADANDEITLQFGIAAQDYDGDITNSVVIVKVADDAPIAHEVASEVDETGLGPVIATGTMDFDYGSDANGSLSVNSNFSAGGSLAGGTLTSGGVAVTVTPTATGYIGMAGSVAVFTLHVNLDTGEYTYTQLAPLDHADGADANDVISLTFGMDVTDFDGDSVTGDITINVADDGPVAVNDGHTAVEDQVLTGNVTDNDDLSTDASNTITQVEFNGGFYNVPTTGQLTVIGNYGTLKIGADGAYTYTAFHNNPDGTDTFKYTLTDFDGDSATADLSIAVSPIDDVPVLVTPDAVVIDESELGTIQVSGAVVADFGTDGPGDYNANGVFTSGGSQAGGALSHNGNPVNVALVGGTYIGTANGETIFTMQINGLGEYTFTLFKSLDHADANNADDVISLNFGLQANDLDDDSASTMITIDVKDDGPVAVNDGNTVLENQTEVTGNLLTNDDAGVDGMGEVTIVSFGGTDYAVPSGGSVNIMAAHGTLVVNADGSYTYTLTDADAPAGSEAFSYTMTDAEGDASIADLSINIENHDDTPVLVAPSIHTVDETDLGTADVIVDGQLQGEFFDDGFGSFGGNGTFVSSGSQLGGALTSGGVAVNVAFDGTTYTGTAGSETIFTLSINADGSYHFELLGTLDHADPNDPNDIIKLEFGVDGTDLDGDVGSSTLTINVKDDVPRIGDAGGDVDESNLDAGPITYMDTLEFSTGAEIGSISPAGNFEANAGGAPLALTSGGVAIIVTQTANGYVGVAGGETVFTLEVNGTTGQYTYTQFAPVDHPDTGDHNDTLNLEFGVEVNTTDGDSASATIKIEVADDGVDARADKNGAEEDQFITGSVMDNDYVGEDNPNVVTNVHFNGADYAVPAGGSVSIAGQFGTLIMNSDGSYSYQATAEDPDGVENFTYTLRDGDGDTDTATLDITVTPDGEPTAVSQFFDVDETNMTPGPMIFNGDLEVDFGGDGVGSVVGNGNFEASASVANGTLTSNGVAVVVTTTATGYVGMAGTETVFTLTLNNDGTYAFQLLDTLDHADATDPNDVIRMDFGVVVSDADGDTTNANVTIFVHDDAPVAYNDVNGAEEDQLIHGNVMNNDEASEDHATTVTNVKFEGTDYTVPTGGSVSINGAYGTLVMNSDGSYTYQATAEDPDGVENFVYTLTDGDGDKDTAKLDITVTPDGEPVSATSSMDVDETDLTPGPEILHGNMNVDFGADGPGTITPNGNTSFGDSVANGQLTSGGVAVVIAATANGYVGMAGSETIFTLNIANDGTYTFQLLGTLDHADSTDPNDVIQLDFGVTIADGDGDTANGQITIHVADDAPVAYADTASVDEGNIVTGNVTSNDELGEDGPNHVTMVTFGGNEYGIPVGGSVVINGQYGNLTMNSDGTYSYTTTSNNVDGVDNFKYTLTDGDGDSDTATLDITVKGDDQPVAVTGEFTVDETDINGGSVVFDGQMNINFGADGAGSVNGNGNFSAGDSLAGGQLTSGGVPVVVSLVGGAYIGQAGGETIFTLNIGNDGSYTFQLLGTLDHADGQDPNDSIQLNFGITAADSDGDSVDGQLVVHVLDDAPVAADDHFAFAEPDAPSPPPPPPPPVVDYVPEANNDSYTFKETKFLENGTISLDVMNNDVMSLDGGTRIVSAVFVDANGNELGSEVSLGGSSSYKILEFGDTIIIDAWNKDGNTKDQEMYIKYVIEDADGDQSTAIATVKQDDNTSPLVLDLDGDGVELLNVSAGVQFDMGSDGTLDNTSWVGADDGLLAIDRDGNGTIDNQSELFGTSDVDGFTVLSQYDSNSDGVIDANDAMWQNIVVWQDKNSDGISTGDELVHLTELDIVSISLAANTVSYFIGDSYISHESTFTYGDGNTGEIVDAWFSTEDNNGDATVTVQGEQFDMPDAVPEGSLVGNLLVNDNLSEDTANLITSVTINGQVYAVAATGQTVVQGQYGQLTIEADGSFFYVKDDSLSGTGTVSENITYTLEDSDGDATNANLTIDIPLESDSIPVISQAFTSVDESDFGTVLTHNGNLQIDYNGDAAGSVNGTGTFNATGSVAGNALTHNGTAINVTYNASTGTYTGKAGTLTVFALKVNTDGSYTYQQFATLDHADTNDANDAIDLNFGVIVSDDDGDTTTTNLTVRVYDDGVTAVNDSYTISETQFLASGTISLNVLSNDNIGSEGGTIIDAYFINSAGVNIGTSINIGKSNYQILGHDGEIVMDAWNKDGNTTDETMRIQYVVRDADGDISTAIVTVKQNDNTSPLVLDLDGDGIELVNLEDGVQFDIDNDGALENVGWAGKDDGLLALDKNGDGIINDQSELFGNSDLYSDGFDNLASYDINQDGIIDASDEVYANLRVWQDSNSDGISDDGELLTLAQIGIVSINLTSEQPADMYIEGNWISDVSSFTMEDGSVHQIVDAWFSHTDADVATVGGDDLYGMEGADTFFFQAIEESAATLHDFNAMEGDTLDISALLEGQDGVTDAINDFVHARTEGGSTVISVDVDGAGTAFEAVDIVQVDGISGLDVQELLNDGNLIV